MHHPPLTRIDAVAVQVEELAEQVRELRGLTAKAVERETDVDALNRAVRRYEKKEAMHSAHTENRICEIDSRLNDVLTLAAAAAARRDETTIGMLMAEWMWAVVVVPFTITWRLLSFPAKAVETVAGMKGGRLLLGIPGRQKGTGRLKGRGASRGRGKV